MYLPRKRKLVRLVALALGFTALVAAQSQAEASTFTGKIQALRFNTGASPARVSIRVGSHGSPCPTFEWFAYENATTNVGALWTAALIEALSRRQEVTIAGNGSCDGFGVEGIRDLDVFRGR